MDRKIVFWVFFILLVSVANGRDYTNKHRLSELSEQFRSASESAKSTAEKKARNADIPIVLSVGDSVFGELIAWPDGEMPVYYSSHNENAAETISVDKVFSGGGAGFSLTGAGVLLGLWDIGAARPTHQEVSSGGISRITVKDSSKESYHAVHVSGTLIASGVVAKAKGMAPAASIHSYNMTSDESEMAAAVVNDNLRISNHSYGRIAGWAYGDYGMGQAWYWFGSYLYSASEDYKFGLYSQSAANLDDIAYNAPHYLICRSAGNHRDDSCTDPTHYYWYNSQWTLSSASRDSDGGPDGYDCISSTANAKNALTVGAVEDIPGGWSEPGDVEMTSFSCWGPTDDGRIKPDIVANGTSLYSSYTGADNAYASLSGTSMACPAVAGSVGLIIEHRRNLVGPGSDYLSSTIKGLICHTADEAGSNDGPDYKFGWGLMNTESCIELMSENDDLDQDFYIQEKELTSGEEHTFTGVSDGDEPIKVTICQTDPKGTPVSSNYLNNRTAMLVHDLDVKVAQGADEFQPWVLDPDNPSNAPTTGDNDVDNVEQVFIKSPNSGVYTITVNHEGSLSSNQKYSIIITGLDPQPRLPKNNSINLSTYPKFEWPEVDGAIDYEIAIASDTNFINSVFSSHTYTNRYFYLADNVLNSGTKYFWKVRHMKNDSTYGPWLDTWTFTTSSGCDASSVSEVEITLLLQGLDTPDGPVETPVLVQLRDGSQSLMSSSVIAEKAGYVDAQTGKVKVTFPSSIASFYWVVVTAPGYMPLATPNIQPINPSIPLQYDFTAGETKAENGQAAMIQINGKYYMRAGDLSGDYKIDGTDKDIFEMFGGKSYQSLFAK